MYQLFGLSATADFPLPLPPSNKETVDITISSAAVAPSGCLIWASEKDQVPFSCYRDTGDERVVLAWPQARFELTPARVIVDAEDRDLAVSLLLQPVWSVVLAWRGSEALHGAAIEHNGATLGILGRSGAGKSTAAHRLLERDWCLVSDDMLVVDESTVVELGPPFIRLVSDVRFEERVMDVQKGKVRVTAAQCQAPTRLTAAVVLHERYSQSVPLHGVAAVEAILDQVYNPLPLFAGQALRRLELALRIVERVPIIGAPVRSLAPEDLEDIVQGGKQ